MKFKDIKKSTCSLRRWLSSKYYFVWKTPSARCNVNYQRLSPPNFTNERLYFTQPYVCQETGDNRPLTR